MTLVHPNYAPRQLTRIDHDEWSLTVCNFLPTFASPTGVSATPSLGAAARPTTTS
jgi:hypothetical protein